jgi:HlyD family secretion protein
LEKYAKGEALQLLRNAQIEITNVLETLSINEERLEWTEKLYSQRYETKANLDKDRLAVSQARLKLEQARQALWMLETFDQPKKKRELEALLQEAKDALERVKLQGESKLAQYKADVQTQKKTLDLNEAKLNRDKRQLQATKIHAPQDGLVVYGGFGGGDRRFSSESMIEEGATVRNRQEIIKLPDVSEMKVQIRIHESHINQIHVGQPAYIVLDSMPDKRFRGFVAKVAPLPDSSSRFGNPNLKVYLTEVRVADPLLNVKPGVSARAEVVITNLTYVLTVPIQAVTTRGGKPAAFLASHPPRAVPVEVGMYNNKFIQITSGLSEGDRVLLAPPFDTQEKDLGGGVIAEGDALPQVDSNQVRRVLADAQGHNGGGADQMRPRREAGGREGFNPQSRGPGEGRGFGESGASGEERRQRGDPGGPGGAGENGAPTGERRQRGGPGGGNFNREEMMRQFDKNGDGQLDEEERAAMRERFGGQRRRGTNAPPAGDGS